MVLKNLFDRFGRRKDKQNETAVIGNDGWVELVSGRLVVHDPAEDGRYATLTPELGVRLWINDEEATEPTAVTASDRIRFEVMPDVVPFLEIRLSDDDMAAELVLTGDPHRLPDTVAIVGRHQVRLEPGYSTRARPRAGSPRQEIIDRLKRLGVEYGVDEEAIEREIAAPTGQPVGIARGQEAQAPTPGQWLWRLDEWSMVEAGQVIAAYQGGTPNQSRITLKGEVTRVYDDLPEPQVYLAGNGTRLVPGGRVVASASGRARPVPTPQGQRVHIFPVHRVEGDLEGELEVQADIIVMGNVRGARVVTTGEFLAMGNVEKSEIRAELISIRGAVTEGRLCTVPAGHCVPLRAELAWLQHQMEGMRDSVHHHKPISEESYREVGNFVRNLRRKAEQMGVNQPEHQAACEEVARVFTSAQGVTGLDLPTVARLLLVLGKVVKAAEQVASGIRDVRVGSLTHAAVWAGRDIAVREKVVSSSLFCGGAIRTPGEATLSQSELVAAGEVSVGVLATVRGAGPVTVRAGSRIEVAEAQPGAVFEIGPERREFKAPLARVAAWTNARGQMQVKQRD